MSAYTRYGFGDPETWAPCTGHPGDPRTEEDPTDDDAWTNLQAGRCPFCQDEGQIDEVDVGTFAVACEGCGAIGPRRNDPHEAVEAWDHRQISHIPSLVRRDRIAEIQEQQ